VHEFDVWALPIFHREGVHNPMVPNPREPIEMLQVSSTGSSPTGADQPENPRKYMSGIGKHSFCDVSGCTQRDKGKIHALAGK
jgi:hypothetical protein